MKKQIESLISPGEVQILRLLNQQIEVEPATTEVSQLAIETGIRDNDEVLRALYTLEGKSLVRPEPKGDFTSNHWAITEYGVQALSLL